MFYALLNFSFLTNFLLHSTTKYLHQYHTAEQCGKAVRMKCQTSMHGSLLFLLSHQAVVPARQSYTVIFLHQIVQYLLIVMVGHIQKELRDIPKDPI